MTERLPNAIESNWQNILGAADGAGGFLRVSHNDDGTLKSAAITTGLAYTPVNKAGDTMSAPLRLKGPIYDVKAYGALGNGSTDDTAAIQSAIAAVVAAGGGTVFFPAATYIVNGTLDLTDIENVHLVGAGGQTFAYTGLGTTGTILKRLSGTGTMIKWEASTAAQSLRGCMIEGMSINGNQLAATCVSLKSLYGGIFRDLDIRQATTACLALNTVDLVGTEDLQFCRFENIEMRVDPTTGKGIVAGSYRSIGTGYVGNVSFNLFSGLVIYTVNGTAIELNDTDTNPACRRGD